MVLILRAVEEAAFGGEQLTAKFQGCGGVFLVLGQDLLLSRGNTGLSRRVWRMMYHCCAMVSVLFHDQ